MIRLDQALASATPLRSGVPGWLGRLLSVAQVNVATPSTLLDRPVDVWVDGPGVHAVLVMTIRVGVGNRVTFTVHLDQSSLYWGPDRDHPLGGPYVSEPTDVSLTISQTGEVEWDLGVPDPEVGLPLGAGGQLASFGLGTGGSLGTLALELDSQVTLRLNGAEPQLQITGRVVLSGLEQNEYAVPYELTWGPSGIDGRAEGVSGEVRYVVGWAGGSRWHPDTLLIDVPVPSSSPVSMMPGTRLHIANGRTDGTLVVEVVGAAGGIVSSTKTEVAAAGALLAASGAAHGDAEGMVAVSAIAGAASVLAHKFAKDAGAACRVTRASYDLDRPHRAAFDYVAELGFAVDVGVFKFHTQSNLRVSVRDVVLDWTHAADPRLDWHGATVEVGDPGQWVVDTPGGLIQVDKVRSGHGSQWFELDLRFALDLGPVEIDKATIRVTLPSPSADGTTAPPHIELRGFGVHVSVPGLVEGSGALSFEGSPPVFHASLAATIPALKLSAAASLTLEQAESDGHPYTSFLASLAVDLPAPIPLGATGLGLYAVSGKFGLNRAANFPEEFEQRLAWDPDQDEATQARDGSSMVGLGVAIGTLPDLGYAFSGLGKLAVTTPDIAVLAAVSGHLLGGRPSLVDPPDGGVGRLRGVLAVILDKEVSLAVQADYTFPPDSSFVLFRMVAPVEGYWPVPQADHWYVHLGTDPSHAPGPIRAVVLPDILGDTGLVRGEAFVMVHGHGIDHLDGLPTPTSGLVVAAGINLAATLICLPAIAQIYGRAVVIASTHPVFLVGRAAIGGRLRLGPFALGIDAGLDFQLGPGHTYAASLRVCGEIDLWLTSIRGCVSISLGNRQTPPIEEPEDPFVSFTVTDHRGVSVTASDGAGRPVCWPDATVQLGFAPAPDTEACTGSFDIGGSYVPSGSTGDPATYHVDYQLTDLSFEVLHEDDQDDIDTADDLPATWQTKPGEAAVPGDGAGTLALFTLAADLWTGHLTDGGIGDPSDLLGARERACPGTPWPPHWGWALGREAVSQVQGRWTLPTLSTGLPPSGLDSRVRVLDSRTTWPSVLDGGGVASPGDRAFLPINMLGTMGRVVVRPVSSVTGLPDRDSFDGYLELPDVVRRTVCERGDTCETTLWFSETLEPGALLVLVSYGQLAQGSAHHPVVTESDEGAPMAWEVATERAWAGGRLSVWRAPKRVASVRIHHTPRYRSVELADPGAPAGVGVVALGGVTAHAKRNADAVSKRKPFTTGAPFPESPQNPPYRGPLYPNRRHSVSWSWAGTAHDRTKSVPNSGPGEQTFTVAKEVYDTPSLDELLTSTRVFHPAMMARYVRGYRPDHGMPWFTDDKVEVVLDVSSLTVANAYDLLPTITVEHTDETGEVPISAVDIVREGFDLLAPYQQEALRRTAIALECAVPNGPVRVRADADLLPERDYQLVLDWKDGHAPPRFDRTRMQPVPFRTSRWRSPREMFGFAGFGNSAYSIGLPVAVSSGALTGVADRSDSSVRSALGGVRIDPLAGPIRTTVVLNGSVAPATVAGVLVECREPLLRGPALSGLALNVGATSLAGDPNQVWTAVMDRASTAVLFLPRTAAPPPGQLCLTWTAWGTRQSAVLDATPRPNTTALLALAKGSA